MQSKVEKIARKKENVKQMSYNVELLFLDDVEFNEKMKQNAIKRLSNLLLFLVFDYQFVVFFMKKFVIYISPSFSILCKSISTSAPLLFEIFDCISSNA